MIDANSQFYAILTAVGEAKQVKADAGLLTWKISHMAVGDANNTDPLPDRLQKVLINERRRAPLNSLGPDPANPGILVAEQIIPADEGGFWIRELGLFDSDGDLVAVANCAPSFKPKLSQGSGRTQTVRMNFIVKSSANVVLNIDPSVVTATRKYVDDSVVSAVNGLDYKGSVLVATTAPVVLAGVQVIDGLAVPAGARVLVKDQAKAADNGLYLVTAESWVRTIDADNGTKVTPGLLVAVERGQVNADTLWFLATDGAIVLGTTPLTFKGVTQGLAPLSSVGNVAGSRGVSASTQLSVTDVGWSIGLGGMTAYTVTLPDVADVQPGAVIALHCRNSIGVTVASKVGSQISPQGAYLSSITMAAGESATFVREGSIWVVYGLAALKYSQLVSASTGESGFLKHPSGMIEQWGAGVTDASGNIYVTFPLSWPDAMRNIGLLHMGTAGLMGCVVRGSVTKTGCTFSVRDGSGAFLANWLFYWRALGV
ncbi:phage tail protein [Pseudomonas cyclaminis]|uniref:phage tail protein n=1 Tax=Pseudomonas cyclaminis TaxID=2781239 RepID=UPI003821DB7F